MTEFVKRKDYQISGLSFVWGFFQMFCKQENTLEKWAEQISLLIGNVISVQSLQGKLQFRQVKFCKALLKHVINKQLYTNVFQRESKLLGSFNKVLVEDSTCIALPKNLMSIFPGGVNHISQVSTAKIQLLMDLKSEQYMDLSLHSYRVVDQKFAGHIINFVNKGDLVIRDLGIGY